jgi:hypothetical protein
LPVSLISHQPSFPKTYQVAGKGLNNLDSEIMAQRLPFSSALVLLSCKELVRDEWMIDAGQDAANTYTRIKAPKPVQLVQEQSISITRGQITSE